MDESLVEMQNRILRKENLRLKLALSRLCHDFENIDEPDTETLYGRFKDQRFKERTTPVYDPAFGYDVAMDTVARLIARIPEELLDYSLLECVFMTERLAELPGRWEDA